MRRILTATLALSIVAACGGPDGSERTTIAPAFAGAMDVTTTSLPRFRPFYQLVDDFTGDGRKEILLTSHANWGTEPENPGTLYMVDAGGRVMPGWPKQLRIPNERYTRGEINCVATGDLNGDGKSEIVLILGIMTRPSQSYLFVLDGNGRVQQGFPKFISRGNQSIPEGCGLALADIDDDGGLDIVLRFEGFRPGDEVWMTPWLTVLDRHGDVLPGAWPIRTYGSDAVAVGDVTGDGRKEIVLGGGSHLMLVKANGEQIWLKAFDNLYENGNVRDHLTLADVTGDGRLEILANTPRRGFLIVNADGEQVLHHHRLPTVADRHRDVAVADLNLDGKAEAIFLDRYGGVYVMNADGSALPGWPWKAPFYSTVWGRTWEDADRYKSIGINNAVVGDLDGDGFPEVAVWTTSPKDNHQNWYLYVLKHDGAVAPGYPRIFSRDVIHNIREFVLTDVDLDGKAELVIFSSSIKGIYVHILRLDVPFAPELAFWTATANGPLNDGLYRPPTGTVVATPPRIAAHPGNKAVRDGQRATFTVSATGTGLVYQWLRNGAVISGATGASYTTPVTRVADSGARYRCRVTNTGGTVLSSEATLTVIPVTSRPCYQNPRDPLDVNNDGYITPFDVLLLTNELNANGPRALPTSCPSSVPAYWDVNGDGHISPLDVVIVVNFLNGQ